MSYSFEPYLDRLSGNWYADDPLLQRLLARYGAQPDARTGLDAFGATCAHELSELAQASARIDNLPFLEHFDAYSQRVDEVCLPQSTHTALGIVQGKERLGFVGPDRFTHYAKVYLFNQNGEAGVACSTACTDGLVRALDALGTNETHNAIAAAIRGSRPEQVVHGAQFITEIQGGSDVPANTLRAEAQADGSYRLSGQKWFCSNINADYFLVTARSDGADPGGRGVALFVVPAYLEGEQSARNGYSVDRLKEKLGTRELATAEVTFEGAVAWPLGPLDRGVANVVSFVLVTSRLHCVISGAAFLRQAERITTAYTEFRTAFGTKLCDFPLVAATLEALRETRERATVSLFALLELERRAATDEVAALDFRVLMSLAKPEITQRATALVHEAMMLLGANGIEERFSPLPRLWRDAAIVETWEGPHNVLYTQALRDLGRFDVDPDALLERWSGTRQPELANTLGNLLASANEPQTTVPFASLAGRLFDLYADRIRAEVGCVL